MRRGQIGHTRQPLGTAPGDVRDKLRQQLCDLYGGRRVRVAADAGPLRGIGRGWCRIHVALGPDEKDLFALIAVARDPRPMQDGLVAEQASLLGQFAGIHPVRPDSIHQARADSE